MLINTRILPLFGIKLINKIMYEIVIIWMQKLDVKTYDILHIFLHLKDILIGCGIRLVFFNGISFNLLQPNVVVI